MRKRIWKKILTVGTCLLAQTGILAGCTAQPAMAQAFGMESGVTVFQEAVWTDLEKFQAKISVSRWPGGSCMGKYQSQR